MNFHFRYSLSGKGQINSILIKLSEGYVLHILISTTETIIPAVEPYTLLQMFISLIFLKIGSFKLRLGE